MSRRILTDVAIGVVVTFLVTVSQYAGYLVAALLGSGLTYDTAPENPASAPGWLDQINTMMLVAAIPAFVITLLLGWLLKVTDVNEGLVRGLVWTAVVAVAHLAIGFGNGTQAMFATYGLYVLFVAVWLGPVVAGWWRSRGGAPQGGPGRQRVAGRPS